MGDMMTLMKLKRGAYSLVDEKIAPQAKAIGVAIKTAENCIVPLLFVDARQLD
jgi:trk system potassium uptake protein TrkA